MIKTVLKASALSAALVLSLGAAGVPAFAQEVVYNRGNDTDPASLDQHKTSTIAEAHVLRDLYEGLVVYDTAATVIPGVAESWEISEDGTVYTFRLRDNARWSNGDPVTAEDFVFALRRIQDPATAAGYANILYPILNAAAINRGEMDKEELGARAVDERTLEITLEAPTPYFLELLTHQTALPLHRPSVEAHGDAFTRPGNLVSNGAFTLQAFVPNDRITLVANPHFHAADEVSIDVVNYIPFEDRAACVRRFEAGEVQSCSDLPTEQLADLRGRLGDQVRIAPYLGIYYLPVKTTKPVLSDPRVRRAISLVIDREFLAEEIWSGTMIPAYSLVPPGIANYVDGVQLPYADEDILDREDRARELLAEAGVAEGSLTVDLRYNTSENNRNTMTALGEMLRSIGINSTLTEMEGATYFPFLRADGDFDIARAGWIGDYNDPQNFLFLYESDNLGFNYPRWANEDYDALMAQAAQETDLDARAEILADAERLFLEHVPAIPILYYTSRSLVSPRLQGWEDNIMNVHGTRFLSLN